MKLKLVKKSKIFSDELIDNGATFPLTKVFGNPSTRKPFDEGYFITDAKKQLFHLKMQDAKPMVNRVKTGDIEIEYILSKEHRSKEFYGVVVSLYHLIK